MLLGSTWRCLADLVFPPACAVCEQTITEDAGPWCLPCTRKILAATAGPYCPRCAMPVGPYRLNTESCSVCRDQPSSIEAMARVGPYHGVVGDMVKRYKYGRQQRLDRPLSTLLASALRGQPWHEQLDAFVPVPTNWRGRLHYGFHPVGILAAGVARELNIPSLPLVRQRRKRRKQVGLPLSERAQNIRGVFAVDPAARVTGATLCIIDDVATSGSTLREMSKVLKQAGAAQLYAAVLCKTDPTRPEARFS